MNWLAKRAIWPEYDEVRKKRSINVEDPIDALKYGIVDNYNPK